MPSRKELEEAERTLKLGGLLFLFGVLLERISAEGALIRKVCIRPPHGFGEDWMAVINVQRNEEAFVGFVSAGSMENLMHKLVNGLRDDTIKWKEDVYAK